jgi:murein DD-endopeptidase MepM/ murein hydrolase activator NlpD
MQVNVPKKTMKRTLIYTTILFLLITPFTLFLIQQNASPTATPAPPQPAVQAVDLEQIKQAIQQAISREKAATPALLLFQTQIDRITISEDNQWATAWLVPIDPETGQPVPTEPGLVIVRRQAEEWRAVLPSDSEWLQIIQEAPSDLLNEEAKNNLQQMEAFSAQAILLGPFTGYKLPYAGGETMALTQSIGHDRYTPSGSAHYAFDFAKPGYPSGMFNIHAAKGGTVTRAIWTNPNGDEGHANYIVLEDTTTTPTTYQLYMHLAQDSIPPALRVVGTQVHQGQFIGIADDTGVSSGNHLHFMVHTTATSYWGTSVDITFSDVSINGGRPRIKSDLSYCDSSDVCDQTQTNYTSQNYWQPDSTPPTGGLLLPSQGRVVDTANLDLAGWGTDDSSGLASAQFNANYNGSWHPVGSTFPISPFYYNWDLCADQVPDGPVSLALQLTDKASNQSDPLLGLRHITKNYACPTPPPACVPVDDQVAIYGKTDFSGLCVLLNAGSYPDFTLLGNLGDNNADSILVGANVRATLFSVTNFQGRSETFIANDSSLADNLIGANTVSSVLVQTRNILPSPPAPVWPDDGGVYMSDASLSLTWRDMGGADQYQARLQWGINQTVTTSWQVEPVWHLSSLAPGNYTWQVKARSSAQESDWSVSRSIVIQASETSPQEPMVTVPFTDTMETGVAGWTDNDTWVLTNTANHTPGGSKSWKYSIAENGYDNNFPNAGYLTSPPIQIPSQGERFLRFWYQYETEGPGSHWDQRWVQLSADGGPYTNLIQLYDDTPNTWLRSPAISLAAYANHTLRVRFYFVTLDSKQNNYQGWYIDDFSITSTSTPACGDGQNDFIHATLISYGSTPSDFICPGGDVDYYKFQGIAGDQVGAWIEAQTIGSSLDTYLFLLDNDGRSILSENDDQILYQRSDSFIHYQLTRTGIYYLKVRSWDHPTSGGFNYFYKLHLIKDNQEPTAHFLYPLDKSIIPLTPIALSISADDTLSGVSHVQFSWHSADWLNSDWIVLGEDWDGRDGWSYVFDVSNVASVTGIAFYARIYDWAGNWIGTGVWNLMPPSYYLPFIVR